MRRSAYFSHDAARLPTEALSRSSRRWHYFLSSPASRHWQLTSVVICSSGSNSNTRWMRALLPEPSFCLTMRGSRRRHGPGFARKNDPDLATVPLDIRFGCLVNADPAAPTIAQQTQVTALCNQYKALTATFTCPGNGRCYRPCEFCQCGRWLQCHLGEGEDRSTSHAGSRHPGSEPCAHGRGSRG